MLRRMAIGALLLTLIVLVAPPAAAKGPTEVKVHDVTTGATTLLDFPDRGEMGALQLLVGWPQAKKKPRAVGELVHVATLTWQHGDGMVAWLDRIYSDETGTGWVKRRDHLSGSGAVVWGHTSAYAMEAVLSKIQHDHEGTTATIVTPAEGSTRVSAPQPPRGLDADSFAMGAGLAGLLAASLLLAVIRRERRRIPADGGADPTRT